MGKGVVPLRNTSCMQLVAERRASIVNTPETWPEQDAAMDVLTPVVLCAVALAVIAAVATGKVRFPDDHDYR